VEYEENGREYEEKSKNYMHFKDKSKHFLHIQIYNRKWHFMRYRANISNNTIQILEE